MRDRYLIVLSAVVISAAVLPALLPTMLRAQEVVYSLHIPKIPIANAEDPDVVTLAPNMPLLVEPSEAVELAPVSSSVTQIVEPVERMPEDGIRSFRGYRYATSSSSWIVGNGNQFGLVSFDFGASFHQRGIAKGFSTGFKWHLLAGPLTADVPPRVYDFWAGYQKRDWIGRFGYDVSTTVMASSDFEGSAREGVRFPSHAVSFFRSSPNVEWAFGVDYVDRRDVGLLPVGGVILYPNDVLRLQLMFPRPRIDFALTATQRLYLSGELGGGQWAIERELALVDDLLTYSDLRLAIGLETTQGDGVTGVEIAWLFDRKVEFLSGAGDLNPVDTVMLRFIHSR